MFPDMAVKAADLKTEIRATGWVRAGSGSGDATESSLAGWSWQDLSGFGAVFGMFLKILYVLAVLHSWVTLECGRLLRPRKEWTGCCLLQKPCLHNGIVAR